MRSETRAHQRLHHHQRRHSHLLLKVSFYTIGSRQKRMIDPSLITYEKEKERKSTTVDDRPIVWERKTRERERRAAVNEA